MSKEKIWKWKGAPVKRRLDRLPQLADELTRLDLDVIVATTDYGAKAAQQATSTIPVVVIASHGGVSEGFYDTLAHPGGNMTGIDNLSEVLDEKRLEIFRTLLPKLSRLTLLYNSDYPGSLPHVKSIKRAAAGLATRRYTS